MTTELFEPHLLDAPLGDFGGEFLGERERNAGGRWPVGS
jgi:hypothetical protein